MSGRTQGFLEAVIREAVSIGGALASVPLVITKLTVSPGMSWWVALAPLWVPWYLCALGGLALWLREVRERGE